MKKIILFLIFLFLSNTSWATIWYIRDGGGTATQCTGKTNAVYPGSGSNQNCAFNHPSWVLGTASSGGNIAGIMASGDTMYIDGDSDTSPGSQAQYMIGYGMPNAPSCSTSAYYYCILQDFPPGVSSGNPTSMIGTGTHQPQLWGYKAPYQVLTAENDYLTLQNLEITDHDACAYNDPAAECLNNFYPDGIALSGNGLTLTSLYIHGFGRYGINGNGNFGTSTFNSVWTIGNGFGGINIGSGGTQTVTGTLTFNQPIVEWNGCVEAYPLVSPGIDNPANYSNCFGQDSGGYGDGLAFGATTGEPVGNWTLVGPGSISFNTQDGLDILHGDSGVGTDSIDKMRFEGNGGQQLKITGLNNYITNSLIIGDCGWWYGATQSLSGGMQPGDSCRANGSTIRFTVTNSSTANIYNNTIITNAIALETIDSGNTGCNGSTAVSVLNNIIDGGYYWLDDTTWNPSGGNSQTTNSYNDGNDGDGGGTCGNLVFNENYNIIYGNKNSNSQCSGSHDQCGTLPGFASGNFPNGTAGGGRTTYYTGTSGVTLVGLSNSSPAITAGVNGLSYWNTENDYYNVTRASPPSIGGLELNSCAATNYFCQYNSSCCTNTCTNNACTGACTTNGGSCTTGSSCCSTLCSLSVCVACIATGNSCSTNGSCCSGVCSGSLCVIPSSASCTLGGKSLISGKSNF